MKKRRFTIWKTYEWKYLAKLLDKGYPLVTTLQMLQKNDETLKKLILNGQSIPETLITYAKPRLQSHLLFFSSITSFSNAITCSIRMESFEQEIKKKIKKECLYPVFIFMFAYLTLCIFIQFVIPQLLLSFPMDTLDIFFVISIYFLKCFCIVAGVVIFLLCCLIISLKNENIFLKALPFLTKFKVVKEFICYTFSCYMRELEEDGLSTRKSILYLSTSTHQKILSFFMKDLKLNMEEGKELTDIMKESKYATIMFQTCFFIGVNTGNLKDSLTDYIIYQEDYWLQKIHQINLLIQCVSYSFVGFLVIMVYQIMLVPLQMLESM